MERHLLGPRVWVLVWVLVSRVLVPRVLVLVPLVLVLGSHNWVISLLAGFPSSNPWITEVVKFHHQHQRYLVPCRRCRNHGPQCRIQGPQYQVQGPLLCLVPDLRLCLVPDLRLCLVLDLHQCLHLLHRLHLHHRLHLPLQRVQNHRQRGLKSLI